MTKTIRIRRGLDIRLLGEADKVIMQSETPETISVQPDQFFGIKPKVLVTPGTEVKAGTPLMFDKNIPQVMITSPVSGEVIEVVRGEKRKLLEIKILADKETRFLPFRSGQASDFSREEIISQMCESGAWNFIRQRPYTNVAFPDAEPTGIFISAFDSSPLAPDNDYVINGQEAEFQAGLDILDRLAPGKVHLSVHEKHTTSDTFLRAKNVKIHTFSGPHPSGNVGVQMHHILPINKGEYAWHVGVQDVVSIGRLFSKGVYQPLRVVALTGSQLKKRYYVRTILGVPVRSILPKEIVEGEDNRIISGNVLTGTIAGWDGNLGFYDTQLTVIPEGRDAELFGWIAPGFSKFSNSRLFPTWLMPGKKFKLDTNTHGEERAFVVTGEYEKVFPMNIYPVQLLKSIITNDIEQQENLGIYEVAPEDFALCEFVCTSKIESQEIVRQGLEDLYREVVEVSHH